MLQLNMNYKITYYTLMALVTIGLGYIYLHRLDIPLTNNFEKLLDAKLISIDKDRKDLALAVVGLDIDQRQEIAERQIAKSNTYSNPFRALNTEWYKMEIIFFNLIHFLFTYRIIFYVLAAFIILFATKQIFWRYYAL